MTGKEPTVNDAHLLALGRMTAEFSRLEIQVAFVTWCLMGTDQRLGQIITAQLSFRALLTLLDGVVRYRVQNPEQLAQFEDLLVKVQNLEDQRNRLIHSAWAAGDTPGSQTRIKMTARRGSGLKHHFEQVKAKDIERLAVEMRNAAKALLDFLLSLPDEVSGVTRIR